MQAALASGGLNPGDISYINAHGTSTPQGDVCETQAIKTIFGDHSRSLAVSSDGEVYGWGCGEDTRLGLELTEHQLVPRRYPGLRVL